MNRGSEENFVVALAGRLTEHPRLPGARRLILTSSLRAVGLENRWIRTEGRFHRLGETRDFSYDNLRALARFMI